MTSKFLIVAALLLSISSCYSQITIPSAQFDFEKAEIDWVYNPVDSSTIGHEDPMTNFLNLSWVGYNQLGTEKSLDMKRFEPIETTIRNDKSNS